MLRILTRLVCNSAWLRALAEHNPWPTGTRHLRTLYRVFWLRVIDLEILASDGDPGRLMGQVANIFLSISVLFGLPALLVGTNAIALTERWNTEHFFIETSMTLCALICVLNWDAAFPDRQDLLVLGSLPVRPITILLAKVGALFAAPLLAVGVLNMVIGFTWPLVFHTPNAGFFLALRAWPAYWLTLLAGGAFCVFSILTLQCLAANLLPRQLFLRLTPFLQAATLCTLLTTYFLAPSFHTMAALGSPANQTALHYLPAYWFLGLFQQLNGSPHPVLSPLAARAWIALALSAVGAVASLLLSYFRTLPRVVEQPDLVPRQGRARLPKIGTALAGAITRFSTRTLLRSRRHRMILSLYLGIGLALVAGYLKTPYLAHESGKTGLSQDLLLASLITVILTILALRVVSAIPVYLKASWLFQITQIRPAKTYRRAVRIAWLLLGVAPVALLLTLAFATPYPKEQVAAHIAAMTLLGGLLVEICLATFRKIPFACSYLPGKGKIHFAFWAALFFMIRILKDATGYEAHYLVQGRTTAALLAALILLWAALAVLAESPLGNREALVFEEEDPIETITLQLR